MPSPGSREVTATTPSDLALRRGDLFDVECPTRELLDRIGSKWVAMIITVLARPTTPELRFAELERAMPGISHRMLSQELKRLTLDGLVHRRVEDSVPVKVFYRLTPLGMSLHGPISVLREWAEANMGAIDARRRSA
ncbi:helix-turn-helix domain-containing protein [Kineosporia sp. NBRC 101731]|uniref:winged helix-turn-helix transcriptional regulator n=1 Tax=Kineosporia sp. NBRC 101731 TaxID=3032199 RepID=UPI0024A3FD7B|nr:helix-turn-helix domain-containing protein [Kineosporia sp. NBRC 101731]GLY32295.1 HxlR family transcriptional regulator [Kineosporia sp. NBRC 101731]